MRTLTTIVVALLLAAPARAFGGVTETFDGTNVGGWTYGPPSIFETTGGNPGGWLHQPQVDTFAPQVRTTDPASPFGGDYRAKNVTSIGADLITISTQFPAMREMTLQLTGGGGQSVFFLGTEFVPQPGAGWKSFDFAIDAASPVMPPGWTALSGGDPNAVWNAIITDVAEVRFFYGNPTFFYIFDQWNVGIDNPHMVCPGVWTDLGLALAGTLGEPVLAGGGSLIAGDPVTLALSNAPGSKLAYLFIGTSTANLPFKGGTLVPAFSPPSGFSLVFVTNPIGLLVLTTPWPASLPSPIDTYYQYWLPDPGGPQGASASNALWGAAP